MIVLQKNSIIHPLLQCPYTLQNISSRGSLIELMPNPSRLNLTLHMKVKQCNTFFSPIPQISTSWYITCSQSVCNYLHSLSTAHKRPLTIWDRKRAISTSVMPQHKKTNERTSSQPIHSEQKQRNGIQIEVLGPV